MTDREIVKLLKKYKDAPELGGGASDFNWENSWSRVCRDLNWNAQKITQQNFSLISYAQFAGHQFSRTIMQPAAITIAAVVLVLGGWTATVNASYALPGDMLYPVKLAAEKVRLTMASTAQARAELHVEFAGRRLAEISQIEDGALVQMAVSNFNDQMNLVNQELADVQNEDPDAALALAVLVGEKANEYQATLAQNPSEGDQENMASAIEAVNQADTAALDTIVTSHETTGAISTAEVLQQNFQTEYSELRSRVAFSLGRLSVIRKTLTDHEIDPAPYASRLSAADKLVEEAEEFMNQAMDIMAASGYRSAFELLKQAETKLAQAENMITEVEIEMTAPPEPPEPANITNNSFEEVVVPEGY